MNPKIPIDNDVDCPTPEMRENERRMR